jgi:hypothetical protein
LPRAADDHPRLTLAEACFGSWQAPLEAAGIPSRRKQSTSEQVLEALHGHIDRHGRPPLTAEWRHPDDDTSLQPM